MTRILVVEDEPQLLRALRINLAARQYDVLQASNGATALQTAASQPPNLVILDLGLPDMDGCTVIEELRGWTTAPILVLSGRSEAADKVDALDAGADDYVTKPFSMDELAARLRALLRRTEAGGSGEPLVAVGHYLVDLGRRLVTKAPGTADEVPQQVRLTKTEWAVLEILVGGPGRLVSGRELLQQVWGPDHVSDSGYLRFYMARLRRKLEPDPAHPRHLLTEPGMGYRFQP